MAMGGNAINAAPGLTERADSLLQLGREIRTVAQLLDERLIGPSPQSVQVDSAKSPQQPGLQGQLAALANLLSEILQGLQTTAQRL